MKIDFYIAGMQKSGTTNLAYLLSKCSNILTHPQTECTFFYDTQEYKQGIQYLQKNYFWSIKNKAPSSYTLLKHSHTFTCTDTIQRVLKHSPQVTFILIFRNPIHRFISSYLMERTRSLYPHSLDKAIQIAFSNTDSFEHKVFYEFGLYDQWLQNIFKIIPQKNIHLFLFEDLYNDLEHHIEQFANQYHLDIHTETLKNIQSTPIQNAYKEYKYYWYQKLIVHWRHSSIKKCIKKLIPAPQWIKLIKKIEHINLIEPEQPPPIKDELKYLLLEKYRSSIEKFEALTGYKTNWLKI